MAVKKEEFNSKIQSMLELDEMGFPLTDSMLEKILLAGAESFLSTGRSLETSSKHTTEEDGEDQFGGEEEDIYDGRKHLWLGETPEGRGDEPNYFDRIPQAWKDKWKDKVITKEDWLPKEAPEEVEPELRKFILSGIPRFDHLIANEKFWLYCEQARRWGPEANKIENMRSDAQQEAYAFQEFDRASDNKLYGLDGYAWIKDDAIPGGRRKYEASAPQALLMYLKDCGFSLVILKGRQAAITSTFMAAAAITALIKPSYKGALVVDKFDTGKGIFNDKFVNSLQFMPDWWKPDPNKAKPIWTKTGVVIDFEGSADKTQTRRYSTELQIYTGADSQTINSNSPTETYYDEAQKTDALQDIIGETKPTQMAYVDGRLRKVRQQFIWGTGGSGEMGAAFEAEWLGNNDLLSTGKPTKGWITLFFDAFCRPGMDEETFREQYADYMKGKNLEAKGKTPEEKRALFSAHYPMSPQDCFMGGMKTVVPQFIIKKYRDSINALPEQAKSVKGWFEPVYLRDRPTPKGSIIPFYFDEVTFKKAPPSMYDAPVEMFRPPKRGYTGRYFSGTDPVPSDTGTSKHSTAILDAAAVVREVNGRKLFIPTMACLVNHRTNNAKQTFLQSVLARMAYRNIGQRACTEVVEIEQGWNYLGFQELDYIDTYETVRYRTEMPGKFTGGAHPKGVSMKKQRKSDAHLYLIEMIEEIGPFIKLLPFWNQLMNIKTVEQADGSTKWGTKDVRRMNDDVVFSTMYAYMDWKISDEVPFHHGVDEPITEMVAVPVGEPGNLRWEMQEQKLYGQE